MAKTDSNRILIQIDAPKERVFEIMTDHPRYVKWTRAKKVYLKKEGSPTPNGLGAIRVFDLGLMKSPEEVIGWEENRSMTYRLLNQWPLKNYTATMSLSETDDSKTELLWESNWTKRIGATAFAKVLRKALNDFATGIKADAEKGS